jgi:two-component system response regulator DevR
MQLTMSLTFPVSGCPPVWNPASQVQPAPTLTSNRLVGPESKISTPNIALVDDQEELHVLFKDLADIGHFKLALSCYSAAEALERLPALRPDAVIMDIRLPDMSGIDCMVRLKTLLPQLPFVILTGYPDSQNFFRSLMNGASGFLVKPVSSKEFVDVIAEVLKGEFALAKEAVPFLIQLVQQVRQFDPHNLLTRREEQVMACLFEGMQDKEIASRLGIGTATVHTYMHRLLEKLGARSRRELIARYLALASPRN